MLTLLDSMSSLFSRNATGPIVRLADRLDGVASPRDSAGRVVGASCQPVLMEDLGLRGLGGAEHFT